MMSLSPGMKAGQAGGYFSREDYYLKGAEQGLNSRWGGKGAESLGLFGPVREEEFRALCAGRHPVTGEPLVSPKLTKNKETGAQVETHRAGNDCTLSDPKMVSVAYMAGVRGIKEAQVMLWKAEGKFTTLPHARLFEMAALETRDPKREVSREDVVHAFERGLESCGTSALEVKRELELSREIALERLREPPGYSAPEVVRLAAENLIDREAVLDRARLLDQSVLVSGGGHSVRELNLTIDGGAVGVLRLGEDKGREYYTTAGMRRIEERNLERVKSLGGFQSLTTREEVAAYREQWQEGRGVRLTEGQMEQVYNELAGERGVLATIGKAGTGKTLASKFIEEFNREVLQPQGKDHFTLNIAYTGKAALEMEKASGRPGFTVDSFLNASASGKVRLQGEMPTLPRLEAYGEKNLTSGATQVVLRLDEASLVGAKQAGLLLEVVQDLQAQGVQAKIHLIGDTRQMQAIQAGDLFHQVLELGEQGWADVARLNEINRQRDPKLLEIARSLNLEGRTPGENAREALAVMQAGGNVIERERHDEMVSAAGAKYLAESHRPSFDHDKAAAGEKQSVLLITTTNADRKEMNFEIRKARIAAGEIEEGPKFQVLSPASQGITAGEYRKGEEIVFTGYRGDDGRMQRWGARLNTVGQVTGIDLEKNRVAVTYSFRARNKKGEDVFKTVTKKLPAAEMAGKTTVFREEERNFAAGDRIIALRNNRDLGVQNGSLGVIKNLAPDGQVLVDFGSREINLDLKLYKHVDHAYAVTIQKSQGATVEHSILFARVQLREGKIKAVDAVSAPGEECYGRVSYNALNVAITRAQYGGCVFTNSIPDLLREVEHEDRKTSTLNQIPEGPEKSIPSGIEKSAAEKSPDLGVPMNRESKGRAGQERHVNRAEKELPAGGMNHEGFDPGKDRGKDRVSQPAAGEKNRGIDRGKFDRGAKLGAHLDRLALAGKSMPGYQDDLLPKLGPKMPSLGKEIAKQVVQVAVPGIGMELKK